MEEDELFFLSFLLLTGWTAMDYGDLECANLTTMNYFPQNSLSCMFPFRAGHREIFVGDLECFSHFVALTPCCWSADSPHWYEAAAGCKAATAPSSPGFSLSGWLLGQVWVFISVTMSLGFCRIFTPPRLEAIRVGRGFSLFSWGSDLMLLGFSLFLISIVPSRLCLTVRLQAPGSDVKTIGLRDFLTSSHNSGRSNPCIYIHAYIYPS